MTVDVHPDMAPDAEDFVVCWLQPLMRAGTERKPGDVLPFALVQYISGDDCADEGTEDGVIQIDFFDKARNGFVAAQNAKTAARLGHRRMLYLGKHLPDVVISDGTVANADYAYTVMTPKRMEYPDESIVRYVARYAVGLSYVADIEEGS